MIAKITTTEDSACLPRHGRHLSENRGLSWRGPIVALAAYSLLAFLFFARRLVGPFSGYYLGRDTDPSFYMWCLAWWPHALRHHLNPFLPKLVWAPYGTNLTWSTSIPLLAFAAWPITTMLGLTSTFNIVALVSAPLAATCAYLLCRRLGSSTLNALAGGLVFGFSPYMVAQLLSHFVLLLIFPIPVALYLVLRRLDGSLTRKWFVISLTIILAVQFLLLLEALALMTLLGALTIALAIRIGSRDDRRRILGLIPELGAAYVFTALLMSLYLYYFFAFGYSSHPLWPAWTYSADLLNFIIPTEANAVGANRFLEKISGRFPGNIYERGACLGLPLIVIAVVWTRRHRGELGARLLATMLAVTCVLAIGPFLQVAGHPIFPMPWLLVQRLPLLKSTLPIRLMPFAFLAAAMIFTLWMSDPATPRYEKIAGVAFTLLMLIPNPSASFWASPDPVPAFFRDGSSKRLLSPDDIVLPLPFGQTGTCMLWQAESGMNFRMASGLTGLQPIEIRRWPVVNAMFGAPDLPDPDTQVKAFIANTGITAIIIDAADPDLGRWKQLFASLAVTPREISGVLFYRIPADSLAQYRALDAITMETRADRVRFETLVTAAANYIASGKSPDTLSLFSLQSAGLLPAGWVFDPHERYRDVYAGYRDHAIALGVVGSETAVKPIIAGYGSEARTIYFPFPRKRGKHYLLDDILGTQIFSSTTGETMQLLMMTFDISRLQQLAARLSQPAAVSPGAPPRGASR